MAGGEIFRFSPLSLYIRFAMKNSVVIQR